MTSLQLVAFIVVGATLAYVAGLLVRAYLRLRGPRIVECPETRQPVAVRLDLRYAAATSAFGKPHLRLKDCTRWPEKRHCGQMCLAELEAAPQDCLVRNVVARFYEGQSCVYCGKPIGELRWHEHKPGLRTPEGMTLQWSEVPPDSLPRLLATCQPVCWNCYIAESFRHDHSDLVIDGPSRA